MTGRTGNRPQMRLYDEIVQVMDRLERARKTILCEPEALERVQESVIRHGLENFITVRAHDLCPPGQLMIINTTALDKALGRTRDDG